MFNIDALVDAVLQEASVNPTASAVAPPPAPKTEFQKLADVLEKTAKDADVIKDKERFHKLAMAVILDTIEDPKARKGLEALAHDIVKVGFQPGGVMNETPEPGTIGETTEGSGNRTRTLEKQRIAQGRTLFKKLQDSAANVPGPATETN